MALAWVNHRMFLGALCSSLFLLPVHLPVQSKAHLAWVEFLEPGARRTAR